MPSLMSSPANDDGGVYQLPRGNTPATIYVVNPTGGSGGGSDDTWKQSVETRLSTLHDDITNLRADAATKYDRLSDKIDTQTKWLLGLLATATLGLAGLMAHGFKWIG